MSAQTEPPRVLAQRDLAPVPRVASVLHTASSMLSAASLSLIPYRSAEIAVPALPVKRRVRFAEDDVLHSGADELQPAQDDSLISSAFDSMTVALGMHYDAAASWRGALLKPVCLSLLLHAGT